MIRFECSPTKIFITLHRFNETILRRELFSHSWIHLHATASRPLNLDCVNFEIRFELLSPSSRIDFFKFLPGDCYSYLLTFIWTYFSFRISFYSDLLENLYLFNNCEGRSQKCIVLIPVTVPALSKNRTQHRSHYCLSGRTESSQSNTRVGTAARSSRDISTRVQSF